MKKLFIILFSIQMLFAVNVQGLKKGDTIEGSVEHGGKKYYKVGIENSKNVRVKLTNLSGDVNLYTRTERFHDHEKSEIDRVPRLRKNDCYSSNNSNEDEECYYFVDGPVPGDYDVDIYIMIYGIEAGSYTLTVTEEEPEKTLVLTNKKVNDSVEYKKYKQYQVPVKKGKELTVTLSDLTADADLRVKFGRKANKHTFDCKSNNGGTKVDECTVTPKEDGTLYVQVDGYRAARYSLNAVTLYENTIKCWSKNGLQRAIMDGADVRDANTTCLTDMSYMFVDDKSFNQDISSWDVSNVTNMEGMFKDITSFNQDISSWDVSKVTNMNKMFNNTKSFSNHDLSGWDVANVVTKENFADGVGDGNRAPRFKEITTPTTECITIDALKEAINNADDVRNVNTSCITDMSDLFANNSSFNQDISSWDVSNVTNMRAMFKDATSFNQNIGLWDVSNVIYMSNMFNNAISFNQDISLWNVSNVQDMSYMFNNTKSFSNHDLRRWNIIKVWARIHFADNVGDGNRAPIWVHENITDEEYWARD